MRTYKDPKKFYKEISPFLKAEEAKNSLFLGLSYGFQRESEARLFQLAVFEGDRFRAAVMGSRYLSNRNFLPTPAKDKVLAKKFLKYLADKKWQFNGVIAERATAEMYRELLHAEGKKTKDVMVQGIYRCKKLKMPNSAEALKFRMAASSDIAKVAEWIDAFHREATPNDPKINAREMAKAKIEKQLVYVLENKGQIVSMAGWTRDIGSSCAVNLVYTPPKLRGHGFASLVTAKITEHFLSGGKKETNLFTDMTNPTSNKIYQNIGYEFVCNSLYFKVV